MTSIRLTYTYMCNVYKRQMSDGRGEGKEVTRVTVYVLKTERRRSEGQEEVDLPVDLTALQAEPRKRASKRIQGRKEEGRMQDEAVKCRIVGDGGKERKSRPGCVQSRVRRDKVAAP